MRLRFPRTRSPRASARVAPPRTEPPPGDRGTRRHVAPGHAPLARGCPARASRSAELAEEEGISAPSLSGHVDRLETAGLLRRVRSTDDRRRVGLELTARWPRAPQAGPRPPHDLARRPARPPLRRGPRAVEAALPASAPAAGARAGVTALDRAPPAHLPLAPPPPQLPALLRRPGRLARRHLDAEHRARLARDRAVRLAARRRRARVLPLPTVLRLRPRRRRRRRPARLAATAARHAGRRRWSCRSRSRS